MNIWLDSTSCWLAIVLLVKQESSVCTGGGDRVMARVSSRLTRLVLVIVIGECRPAQLRTLYLELLSHVPITGRIPTKRCRTN